MTGFSSTSENCALKKFFMFAKLGEEMMMRGCVCECVYLLRIIFRKRADWKINKIVFFLRGNS